MMVSVILIYIFANIFLSLSFFQDWVSLCSSDCLRAHPVDLTDFELNWVNTKNLYMKIALSFCVPEFDLLAFLSEILRIDVFRVD